MPHPLDPDWDLIDRRKRHLLAIGWGTGSAKLCLVQFHKDGFFVHFPYHPNQPGVITRCVLRAGDSELRFSENGGVVSHHVKYSHHGDGTCLFSQDTKVRSVVKTTEARPLLGNAAGRADHLFSIDVEGLEKLPPITEAERCTDKVGRGFFEIASENPRPIHVVARWTRIDPVDRVATLRNPVATQLPNGELRYQLALSPPESSPLYGSLMLIETTTREELGRRGSPSEFRLIVTGGFATGLDNPDVESSLIAMAYPVEDAAEFPTFDYVSDPR